MKKILQPGYYNEITILKVIATICITWFHFKSNVPELFKPLFIGGMIGNSLFFFCSGMLLKIKEEKFKGYWIIRKLLRLLPSVWIFCLCISIIGIKSFNWHDFVYPTPYWFVNAITCFFYCILFTTLCNR